MKLAPEAVRRYRDLVKPGIDAGQAAAELEGLLTLVGQPTPERPDYVPERSFEGEPHTCYLELADGICLPLVHRETGNFLVAPTLVVRAEASERVYERRAEKAKRKREKRRQRQRPYPGQRPMT